MPPLSSQPPWQRPLCPTGIPPLPTTDGDYPRLKLKPVPPKKVRGKYRPAGPRQGYAMRASVPMSEWVPAWEPACAREADLLHPPRAAIVGRLSAEEAGVRAECGAGVFVRAVDEHHVVGQARVTWVNFGWDNRDEKWEGYEGWEKDVDGFVLGVWEGGVWVREGKVVREPSTSRRNSSGVGVCVSYLARIGALEFRGDGNGGFWIVLVERDFSKCPVGMLRRMSVAISVVVRWLVNRNIGGGVRDEGEVDVEWFYRAVGRKVGDDDDVDVEGVKEVERELRSLPVSLRGYQKRAVAWGLSRERGKTGMEAGLVGEPWAEIGFLDVEGSEGWDGLQLLNHKIMVDVVDGNVSWDETDKELYHWDCRGGMLCDEMGLGKTIEVTGLVVAHKRGLLFPEAPTELNPEGKEVKCLECDEYMMKGPVKRKRNTTQSKVAECRECRRVVHFGCLDASKARKGYVCGDCCEICLEFTSGEAMKSNATLVVVPTILLPQWKDELERHGPSDLDVVVFDGIFGSTGYQPLHRMRAADIVLTTYTALQSDIHVVKHMEATSSRGRRHKRQYYHTPTPLLALDWWRVCMDEAQMVNGSHAMSQQFEMACALKAQLRWCVTGTPIHHSPSELLALLKFLQVRGLSGFSSWTEGVVGSARIDDAAATDRARLRAALRRFVWRTNKSDVDDSELQLPPQTVEVVRLDFGVVERYFYNNALHNARDQIAGSNYGMEGVSRALLERLRQACCHPQVGSGGRQLRRNAGRVLGGVSKTKREKKLAPAAAAQLRAQNPMTMGEVLASMVKKARVDCEDAQRILVASCNGLAGVLLLRGQPQDTADAIRTYRAVLEMNEKNKVLFKMDRIQILHVLHNLRVALIRADDRAAASKDEGISQMLRSVSRRTEREEGIEEEVNRRRSTYMLDSRGRLHKAMAEFHEARENVDELQWKSKKSLSVQEGGSPWWATAFGIVAEDGTADMLLERVVHALMEENKYTNRGNVDLSETMAAKMHTFARMVSTVEESVAALDDARKALLKRLVTLPGAVEPTTAQISESGMCHLCRDFEASGPICTHCKASYLIKGYEQKLYLIREQEGRSKKGFDMYGRDDGDNDINGVWENEIDSGERSPRTRPEPAVSALVQRATRGMRQRLKPRTAAAPMRSELEKVMRELASIVRIKGDTKAVSEMESWFKMLEAMKFELSTCKSAFDAQKEMLAEFDELDQTLQRLTLSDPGFSVQELTRHQRLFTVTPSMLPSLQIEFLAEKAVGEALLQGKRGDLIYLSSLAGPESEEKTQDLEIVAKEKQCPICWMELGSKVALYVCGHKFCAECVTFLINRSAKCNIKALSCPSCRRSSKIDEINFAVTATEKNSESADDSPWNNPTVPGPQAEVLGDEQKTPGTDGLYEHGEHAEVSAPSTNTQQSERATLDLLYPGERSSTFDDPSFEVTGDQLSSKVSAIVRVLCSIRVKDGGKSIIFSQWAEVLNIIAHALQTNSIKYVSFAGTAGTRSRGPRAGVSALEEFKISSNINVLLMPLGKGAAGLNITEATHVFLVEPNLSSSVEAQAISRVHRLSQTKHTFVHRFIVSNTVEDRVRRIAVSRQERQQAAAKEEITSDDMSLLLG